MAIADSPRTAARTWHYFALATILLLAIFLHFFRLDQEGFANLYYAATVKSMLTSWRNWFFAAFDPGGFVTVDKPPLGFWIQTISATLFGFSGWSLLLPQALAGVLSVALIYHLVARVFGATAGLVAALTLTVTPISIAANRNNTMDSQLVFTSLLAAWAISLALERGKLGWLVLGAILVGIGFNIKMLQAVMVLPAFWLTYLIAARTAWWRRIVHLALATATLVIVSLAWVIAVDLTPADQRPFVGSSGNNTELELIVGHNGVARLGTLANWLGLRGTPQPGPRAALPPAQPELPRNPIPGQPPNAPQPRNPIPGQPPNAPPANPPGQPGTPPSVSNETGAPGILRLFNQQLAGQISWLLPLALIGFCAAMLQTRLRYPFAREPQQLLLWILWLAPMIVFFSFAGLFHRYYLEMLSPAIAALVGAGVAAMWTCYARRDWRGTLLPLALLTSALTQALLLLHFINWIGWLIPIIIGMSALAAAALVILILFPPQRITRWAQAIATILGLVALFIAPTIWSLTPLASADSGLPFAGPELLARPMRSANMPSDNRLIEFVTANRNGAKFLVATLTANTAAPIILATGEPVMALGGFSGSDQILTPDQLAANVANNTVRFFWLPADGGQQPALTQWVKSNCRTVQTNAPRTPNPGLNPANQLYDCARTR